MSFWTDESIRLLKRKTQPHEHLYVLKREFFLLNQKSWYTSHIHPIEFIWFEFNIKTVSDVIIPSEKVRFRCDSKLINVERKIWYSDRFSSYSSSKKCKRMSDVRWNNRFVNPSHKFHLTKNMQLMKSNLDIL